MTDSPSMHATGTVHVTCVECHGGNPQIAEGRRAGLGGLQ